MYKTNKEKSKEIFTSYARNNTDKTTIAARNFQDMGVETEILDDIIYKIDLQTNQNFLDIGCGYGLLTEYLISKISDNNITATLIDLPEIITLIKKNIEKDNKNLIFLEGYFPEVYNGVYEQMYDRILLYGVLHYSDDPYQMIDLIINLLKPYGRILLGDLPNISKKGRFLSSKNGILFESKYKNLSTEFLPKYKDHFDFENKMKSDNNYYSKIDDNFIFNIYKQYTDLGYDVYILPQNEKLPFCKTRVDLIISKYD